jgi:hypothetical protein
MNEPSALNTPCTLSCYLYYSRGQIWSRWKCNTSDPILSKKNHLECWLKLLRFKNSEDSQEFSFPQGCQEKLRIRGLRSTALEYNVEPQCKSVTAHKSQNFSRAAILPQPFPEPNCTSLPKALVNFLHPFHCQVKPVSDTHSLTRLLACSLTHKCSQLPPFLPFTWGDVSFKPGWIPN